MNKEKFNPKNTNCEYNDICKGLDDCRIYKGMEHQLIVSANMEYKVGERTFKWNQKVANDFLKRSIDTAGNCPKARDVEIRGYELISKKFGTNS
jgi:hypothetical protein